MEMISAAEGRREGPVFGLHELILDDFAEGGVCSSAHQLADGKHSEGGDKNEERAGNDAWTGEWKNHGLEGFEGSGGFDKKALEFFDGGVEGKDEEGGIGINQAKDTGAWGLEKLERFNDEAGGWEEAVEEVAGVCWLERCPFCPLDGLFGGVW